MYIKYNITKNPIRIAPFSIEKYITKYQKRFRQWAQERKQNDTNKKGQLQPTIKIENILLHMVMKITAAGARINTFGNITDQRDQNIYILAKLSNFAKDDINSGNMRSK